MTKEGLILAINCIAVFAEISAVTVNKSSGWRFFHALLLTFVSMIFVINAL